MKLMWHILLECLRHPRGKSVTYDNGKTWERR